MHAKKLGPNEFVVDTSVGSCDLAGVDPRRYQFLEILTNRHQKAEHECTPKCGLDEGFIGK